MSSPTVDRRLGLVGNVAIKAPVAAVATTNIALSGEQTIDGVAVLAANASGVPDRVLCTGQTSASQNGIWDVSTGSWTRSKDADGNYDLTQGSIVQVVQGSASNAGSFWSLATSGALSIGTSALPWVRTLVSSLLALSFLQAGTGAVARSAQDKMRDAIHVLDYFLAAEASSDAMFQRAIDYCLTLGGGTVDWSGNHLFSSDVTVKTGVHLKGPMGSPGEILPAASADYDTGSGVIRLASTATIRMKDGGMVSGCRVLRSGMNLPFADATAATTGVAAFAGTAFTVEGADCTFRDLLILGFTRAIDSDGYERVNCERVKGDCTNGIRVSNCADISRIKDCHFWPFTTVHQSWTTNALLRRTGTAYQFTVLGDWNKVTDCFSYGYYRGFHASSVNSMTFAGCSADQTSTAGVGDYAGSIGFLVDGTSQDVRLAYCQAAAQAQGMYQNISSGNHVRYIGCDTWAASSGGVYIIGGDATIIGGAHRNEPYGVMVSNAASVVTIDLVRFAVISAGPIGCSIANSSIHIGRFNDYGDWPDGQSVTDNATALQRSVASADPLNLPATGELFQITGTTSFGTINGGWAGRKVMFSFTASLTVSDGANVNLNGPFAATAGDILHLVYNGSEWREVSRSPN